MKRTEGYFSNKSGQKLFFYYYRKPTAKRLMIILHGHGEHIGRYEKFFAYLEPEDISMAAFDFRGCGQSEGRHVYIDDFEDYLSDVSDFFEYLKAEHGIVQKVILFGHSMGGLAAFHWALRNPERIETMILSSPCLGINLPRPVELLNSAVNKLCPAFTYGNPVYPPYLTHNVDEVEKYKKDSLIRRKITARLLYEMVRYGRKISDDREYSFPFPVYFLMAGRERVVDPARTKAIFQKIHAPRKGLWCFEEFYHEIFNELGQEEVFQRLLEALSDSVKDRY